MYCKDCEHLKIISEPYGYEWGQAKCLKYSRTMDFKNHGTFAKISCENIPQSEGERCEICKYYHRLKHNFQRVTGFEESHACTIFADEEGGWVQEVYPDGMCEMFTEQMKGGEE